MTCNDSDSADSLRLNAFNKQSAFNPHIIEALSEDINDYKLIYRSGVEVEFIPQSQEAFSLKKYKDAIGLPYQVCTWDYCTVSIVFYNYCHEHFTKIANDDHHPLNIRTNIYTNITSTRRAKID